MNVLIGCESSGAVRREMRKLGHNAWSCDLLPAEDASPFHIQGDVLDALTHTHTHQRWNLFICFPTCTYVCGSGIHWNKRDPERAKKTEAAVEFFRTLLKADVEKIALENPIGVLSTRVRKPDQIIQPYQFGDDASKATCLWLRNLPLLSWRADQWVPARHVCPNGHKTLRYPESDAWRDRTGQVRCPVCNSKMASRWANQTDSGQNRLGPSEDRWRERSRTYPGIARAMATQWASDHLI